MREIPSIHPPFDFCQSNGRVWVEKKNDKTRCNNHFPRRDVYIQIFDLIHHWYRRGCKWTKVDTPLVFILYLHCLPTKNMWPLNHCTVAPVFMWYATWVYLEQCLGLIQGRKIIDIHIITKCRVHKAVRAIWTQVGHKAHKFKYK